MLKYVHEPVNGFVLAKSASGVKLHIFAGGLSSCAQKRLPHVAPFDGIYHTRRTVDYRNAVSRSANLLGGFFRAKIVSLVVNNARISRSVHNTFFKCF
jgi:hypothetical protein